MELFAWHTTDAAVNGYYRNCINFLDFVDQYRVEPFIRGTGFLEKKSADELLNSNQFILTFMSGVDTEHTIVHIRASFSQ